MRLLDANITPALLLVLPIVIPLVVVVGLKEQPVASAATVLGAFGVVYLMGSIVRRLGERRQLALIEKWGGLPTTIMLRHRDAFLEPDMKKIYHAEIDRKLNVKMPTVEEERADPESADEKYMTAIKVLRACTRNGYPLLLSENIAYQFHRNLLAINGPAC